MAIIEEVKDEDVDNMDFDPADFDPKNPFAKSNPVSRLPVITPVEQPESSSRSSINSPPPNIPLFPGAGQMPNLDEKDSERFKDWQIIYPVYFDLCKSHSEGRRVSKDMAVENPLAESLVRACQSIGVFSVFEGHKTHPKDWANPGRIRVQIKNQEKKGNGPVKVTNKRHLFKLISDYLKQHPTTDRTPFESIVFKRMIQQSGGQGPDNAHPLAVPQGWKLNSVLPLNSPALGGGEASEKMMKDMQKQMFPGLDAPDMKPKKAKVIRQHR